ncbi:radical SAM protein [uncultured Candidatus Kuenenia sp.]|uniref:B12-binding domain-containing radical SAM protein n=1 Tax=uncultured Candidatus Kuenenia sp. TaxID=1048336 RepID=UPI0002E00C1C|nr:radical SAM protein [uncultured Candidatus Kuenenia sp.]
MITKCSYNRILLINPPGKVYVLPDGTPAHRKHCTPPLGLAYIAANLLQNGYEVQVMDILAEGYKNEFFKNHSILYGLSTEDILARIEKAKPDIIGISVLFSFLIMEVFELCKTIKENFPAIPIVLGGQHPSGAPEDVMKCEHVDFVIVAEADQSMVFFLESMNGRLPRNEVPNLYYRENGEIQNTLSKHTPATNGRGWSYYNLKNAGIPNDIDKLPFPAWDIFPLEDYWNSDVRIGGGDVVRKRHAVMISTRGCPHACNFCTSPLMSGYRGYRMRKNEEVIREIRWLVSKYDVGEIAFLDDNFFVSKPRVKRLLKMIAEEFPNIYFHVPGGTEVNALDHEMIDLLAEAHFYKVQIAIEAADQGVQNALIDKKVKIDRVPEMIDYLKSKGIETRALFMIGFPGETRAQIQKTVDLAKSLDVDDFYISIVTPLPGTPIYDECLQKGLFVDGFDVNKHRYSSAKIKLPDTTPDELEKIRRDVWLEVFNEKRKKMQSIAGDRLRKFTDVSDYERVGFTSLGNIPKSISQKDKK